MRFTILTATYNRAHTLEGLYHSLCAQIFHDFEWVIVDDGSYDGTRELVASWRPFFPIRYTWKPNGGKHTAVNIGVKQAAGEFTLILDSDDRLLPLALERFDFRTRQPPDPDRFAMFTGLCFQPDGLTLVGKPFLADCTETASLAEVFKLPRFERRGVLRTEVLRRFPYPVFANERYVSESLVWNRIMLQYPARYFNEPLAIWGHSSCSVSGQHQFLKNPKAGFQYHGELALAPVPVQVRARACVLASAYLMIAIIRETWIAGKKIIAAATLTKASHG